LTSPDTPRETASLPLGQDKAPVFSAPWEARVFAMTLQAHQAGVFTWSEWAETLGVELARNGSGSSDTHGYYDHWLNAFEKLLTAKDVAEENQLSSLRDAWDAAARATPHGEPIELGRT